MPKGRPPGSKNKPNDNPKPRKPYTSTKRVKTVVKEDLLDRLNREVSEQALAIIPCDNFEAWLAAYATHEGNDYERRDQHDHTYNSTHHRVVTYGCNHITKLPKDDHNLDIIACDAILDVYYFYESAVYQIVKLGEHAHEPSNTPIDMGKEFSKFPGTTNIEAKD